MKKKLILTAILVLSLSIAMLSQSYTTGTVILSAANNYTAKVDVDQTAVTLTLVGPANVWLGIGFTSTCMGSGQDVLIYNNSTLSDRQFIGIGEVPTVDTNQDWTIQSDDQNGNLRTVVATRALSTVNDPNDFSFSASENPIDLIWAVGLASSIGNHGAAGRVNATEVTLGIQDIFAEEFAMYPNPTDDKVEITLPRAIKKGTIYVTDNTGRIVMDTKIRRSNKTLDIGNLPSGMYFLNFETLLGNVTKKIIKK